MWHEKLSYGKYNYYGNLNMEKKSKKFNGQKRGDMVKKSPNHTYTHSGICACT